MNIGVYLNDLGDVGQMKYISTYINDAIDSGKTTDASIFYNDVGYNPFDIKCGIFNSTDLWNFSGSLIVTSISCLSYVSNIVNNIDLYYYYGWEKKINVLEMLSVLQNKEIKIICNSEKDEKELYRLTGLKSIFVCSNYQDMLNLLQRCKNGCSQNCKNVCRSK